MEALLTIKKSISISFVFVQVKTSFLPKNFIENKYKIYIWKRDKQRENHL